MDNLLKSNAAFCIRFSGENEIDASLLAKTINDIAELTKIAAKEECHEVNAKLNVVVFEPGSFQIDFSAIVEMLPTLMTGVGIVAGLTLTVVKNVKGIFDIKKHIGDKKAKSISDNGNDSIIVENENGDKLIAPKGSLVVINNIKVDNLVANVATSAKAHNPEGTLTFSTENEKSVFSPDDLIEMSKTQHIEETILCRKTQIETILKIKKPDILLRTKWDFYYNDKLISAKIDDDGWLEQLHNREFKIGCGDSIKVILEQSFDLDSTMSLVEGSERYTVIKVIENIEFESEQMKFQY